MSIPLKDSLLVNWGLNFDQKGTLSPVTYALSAAQMTAFHAAYQTYAAAVTAVATAREAGSRSKLLTQNRNAAKAALLSIGRMLYAIVQNSTSVTDANKSDIGVVVRKTSPTPIPVPTTAPVLTVMSTVDNTVKLRLSDAARPGKKAKPVGVDGASVFSFIGAAPPTEESAWVYQGVASRDTVSVTFPGSTPPGAKVWFTAFWFNKRKQPGPATTPISVNIPGGAAMAA